MTITDERLKLKNKLEKIDYDTALEKSKEYFDGGEMEASVFLDKYALKDNEGNLYEATPDDMHERLAKELFRIESKYPNPRTYTEILDSMKGFKYLIPQGSPMAGTGNLFQIMSLSNCFVVHNDSDSYGGIMRTDEQLTHLMKRRAGVGTDISHLRPATTPVNNAARSSTGAVSFMERYSNTTREVAQSGRRGALMLTISGLHPDVEDFIDIKMDEQKVTGANISIRQFDTFLEAVDNGDDEFTLHFPVDKPVEEATFTKVVNPQEIWNKIIKNAHSRAEPGLLFWDTIIDESIPDCYSDLGFKTISTNPCGEITLCDKDSCRLLAINLWSFVKNPFTEDAYFDWETFEEQVILGERLMDDIIDLELESVQRIIDKIEADEEPDEIKFVELSLWRGIKEKAEQGRRTGLGITAVGDMLAGLGIRYGSDESIEFMDELMKFKKHKEYESSVIMAEERGSFPIWDPEREKDNPFLLRLRDENPSLWERMMHSGRRNIALSTIAPTGTTSMMARTTSGIENLFLPVYFRSKKVNPNDANVRVDYTDEVGDSWQEYPVFHYHFKTYLKANGLTDDDILSLTKEEADEWVEKSPYYGATVNDVDWVKKVELQGVVQKHIDHSISVTVNLPEDIPVEKVHDVYMKAWKSGCKGVTIYRDGSRGGVLNTKSKKDQKQGIVHNDAPKRPDELPCDVYHTTAKGERWTVFVGILEGNPYEVFATRGEHGKHRTTGKIVKVKQGHYKFENGDIVEDITKDNTDEESALTRLISTSLRHGARIDFVVEQLNKSEGTIVSFSKAIARQLKKYVGDEERVLDNTSLECPDDGQECQLIYEEGCVKCAVHGKSKCT